MILLQKAIGKMQFYESKIFLRTLRKCVKKNGKRKYN